MEAEENKQEFSLSKGWKISSIFLIVMSIALSVVMLCFVFPLNTFAAVFAIIFTFVFMLLAMYCLFLCIRYRLTIVKNIITVQGAFFKTIIDISNYDSYRINNAGNSTILLFINSKDKKKKNSLELLVENKEQLFQFVDSKLVSLDQEDIKEDYANITQDDKLGTTEEERIKTLNKARKINGIIFFLVLGICVADLIFRKYIDVFIITWCIIPIIALLIVYFSGGLIKFDTKRNTLYPSVLSWFLLPMAMLMLELLSYIFRIIDWKETIFPILALAIVLLVVFLFSHKNEKVYSGKGLIIAFLFFALMYGFTAALNINVIGKQEVLETYVVNVIDKRMSSGSGSKDYYLKITPWGKKSKESEVSVSRRFYESTEINDNVNVNVYKGKLNIKYYKVRRID